MLPNLPAIGTHAGRIVIGATVRSTRYRAVQGLVTAIYWNGYNYAIQVDDRHRDDAGHFELLSENTHQGFNYVNPNTQQVLSGQFEVLLPGRATGYILPTSPSRPLPCWRPPSVCATKPTKSGI